MKKLRIFMRDWLFRHPYENADSTDIYYLEIANRILNVLAHTDLYTHLCPDGLMKMSVDITCMFEDVISESGIWKAFTEETRRRTGSYLPFFDTSCDYYPGEINLPDVEFMLWYCSQHYHKNDTVISPGSEFVQYLSPRIFGILDSVYETAPENERLVDFLRADEGLSFDEYMLHIHWLHFNSILNIRAYDVLEDALNDLYDEENVFDEKMCTYGIAREQSLTDRHPLWAMTTPEWMACLHHGKLRVEVRGMQYYLFSRMDDNYVYLRPMKDETEELSVVRHSCDISAKTKPDSIIVTCMLVRYEGEWNQLGLLYDMDISEYEKVKSILEEDKELDKFNTKDEDVEKKFLAVTNGLRVAFVENFEAYNQFLTSKLETPPFPESAFPMPKSIPLCAFQGTEQSLQICPNRVEAIKHPSNPYYDKAKAENMALDFVMNERCCSYEQLLYMWDNGMLPDVMLKCKQGKEYGRRILQDNFYFFVAYLRQESETAVFD